MSAIFSFKGRASRREFWLQALGAIVIFAVSWIFILSLVMQAVFKRMPGATAPRAAAMAEHTQLELAALALLICFVCYGWAFLAVSARRLHDLGRPFSLSSFDFGPSIACGFRRGSIGQNSFGPDPLEIPNPPK